MIPFDDIYEKQDRSWSLRLVDLLATSPKDDALYEIREVLEHLADPRTIVPLQQLLPNSRISDNARTVASKIMASFQMNVHPDIWTQWWHSGDEILRTHAVRVAPFEENALVERIASNPQDPMYSASIERMQMGFDEPRFQHLLVKALSHEDPAVRQTAASSLYGRLSFFSEDQLFEHLHDGDFSVESEVIHTLVLCRSVKGLEALHKKRLNCAPELQQEIDSIFISVLRCFKSFPQHLEETNSKAAGYLKGWLSPVNYILEADEKSERRISKEDEDEITRLVKRQPVAKMSLKEFEEIFGDPNGEWKLKKDSLWRLDWSSFDDDEKQSLAEFLTTHPDPYLRAQACAPLSRWNNWQRILTLLSDPFARVRWSAALSAGRLSHNSQIEQRLKSMISNTGSADDESREALGSYLNHASLERSKKYLLDVAITDSREAIRTAAVYGLIKKRAKEEISSIRHLINEPPDLTWSFHTALIEGCTELDIPIKNWDQFQHADDVHLQFVVALAKAKQEG